MTPSKPILVLYKTGRYLSACILLVPAQNMASSSTAFANSPSPNQSNSHLADNPYDPAQLFKVDGLVAVVTGGGSGE